MYNGEEGIVTYTPDAMNNLGTVRQPEGVINITCILGVRERTLHFLRQMFPKVQLLIKTRKKDITNLTIKKSKIKPI